MQERYSVQEYAEKMKVNPSTVYRWIQQGKVSTEQINGVIHIVDNHSQDAMALIAQMQSEVEYLRKENAELRQELAESRSRSDTIVLQLTQQNQMLLEDLRPKRRWYHRLFAWNGG